MNYFAFFFLGELLALLLERFFSHWMFNIDLLLEYLSSKEDWKKIIFWIIIIGAINPIFITYSARGNYGMEKI